MGAAMGSGVLMRRLLLVLAGLLLAGCTGGGAAMTGGEATAHITLLTMHQHRERPTIVVINGRVRNDAGRGVDNVVLHAELTGPAGNLLGQNRLHIGRMQQGETRDYRIVIDEVPAGRPYTPRVWVANADY